VKIAICISGHLRDLEANAATLLWAMVAGNDCDVFIHTWDTLSHGDSGRFATRAANKLSQTKTVEKLPVIRELLRPRGVVVEQAFEWNVDAYGRGLQRVHQNVPLMFYKVAKCHALAKSRDHYDLYVRTRGDVRYLTQVDFRRLDPSVLYVPPFPRSYSYKDGYNDQVAVGGHEAMDAYAGAFISYPEMARDRSVHYAPEVFLKRHLDSTGVPVRQLEIRYQITRPTGFNLSVP
jgi:hypothetical protein